MTRHTTTQRPRVARAAARPVHKVTASRRAVPRHWLALGGLLALVGLVALALALRAGRGNDGALATLTTGDFHALAFSPDDPDVLFFGHHNGILRSDDGGERWRPLVDRRNFDAMGLAVSPTNPRQLYLAGHDIFQVSTDGGATWQPVAHNLPGTDIHGFAMSPDDPNRPYAMVVGHGVLQSADGGRTWQRLPGQLPGDVMSLAVAGGDPATLYAGSMRSGVLRSTDGGRTWAPAVNGLDSRGVQALAVDPVARQTVYAGVEGGLYKSTDGGASWSGLPFPGDNAVTLAVSPARPNRVLAITVQNGQGLVYRSEDGGLSWGGRE